MTDSSSVLSYAGSSDYYTASLRSGYSMDPSAFGYLTATAAGHRSISGYNSFSRYPILDGADDISLNFPYLHPTPDVINDHTNLPGDGNLRTLPPQPCQYTLQGRTSSNHSYLEVLDNGNDVVFRNATRILLDRPWAQKLNKQGTEGMPQKPALPPRTPHEYPPLVPRWLTPGRPTTLPGLPPSGPSTTCDSRPNMTTSTSTLGDSDSTKELLQPSRPRRHCVLFMVALALVAAAVIVGVVVGLVFIQEVTREPPDTTTTVEPVSSASLPPATTEAPVLTVSAYIKEPVTLKFAFPLSHFPDAEIFHENKLVAIINGTSQEPTPANASVKGSHQSGNFQVEVSLSSVSCADAGEYKCVTKSDGGVQERKLMFEVKGRPKVPSLQVPSQIAETYTTNPVCSVSSLGYNPQMTFTWLQRLPNGNKKVFPREMQTDSIQTGDCNASGNSTLKVGGYIGMNNSDICCQLTDSTNSSIVVFETCRTLLTIPANYCSTGETHRLYPYEPCDTFVQCANGAIYFNSCHKRGCFDVSTIQCSLPVPVQSSTGSPATPPFTCNGASPIYVPYNYTYPSDCRTFQRCVGGSQPPAQEQCREDLEFAFDGDPDIVCALPSITTYCGKKLLQEPVKVAPMEDRSAYIDGSATFVCDVQNIARLQSICFSHNGQEVACLNVTQVNVTRASVSVSSFPTLVSHKRLNISGSDVGTSFRVSLAIENVTCADAGSYRCVAMETGTWVKANSSAELAVQRHAEAPVIELPDYIVETRTTANPRCIAKSLGYNPAATFTWLLMKPSGSEDKLQGVSQTPSKSDCNTSGTSTLEANGYVGWNNSDLCCQLTYPKTTNVTNKTCQKLLVLPVVDFHISSKAVIGQPFSIDCAVRNASTLAEVDILHENQSLALYNITTRQGSSSRTGIAVGAREEEEFLRVVVNFTSIACSDNGSYACSVREDNSSTIATSSTTMRVRRLPSKPSLTVPDVAEGWTDAGPTCQATSMGVDPAMTFVWLLRLPNGTEEIFATSRKTDTINDSNKCNPSGSSQLDAQRYRGWNASQVCCQLRDLAVNSIAVESCQLILAVPENYCTNGTEFLLHPYAPCGKFVHCSNQVPYVQKCPPNLCFNLQAQRCGN